jgi:CRP-like cAMP-binding protein
MSQSDRIPFEMQRLLLKLDSIADLSAEDKDALLKLPLRIKSYPEDSDIAREGDRPTESCLVLEGFCCRYKIVQEGKRQIMSFHTPGDMPDLQSIYLKTMDHSIGTLVPTKVAFIPHQSLIALTRRFPGIAAAFWRDTLIDAAIFREWMIGLGRRDAISALLI